MIKQDVSLKIAKRKARWQRFMDMQSDVKNIIRIRYLEEGLDRPQPHPYNKQERIEWAWAKYQRQLEQMQWLDDDALPYLNVYTGTEIFAEAFGCNVHRVDDNMPFALPLVTNASQAAALKVPDFGSTPLTILFDIADELRRRAGDEALVQMVDVQSPMDIAALIWDKNDFYPAMIQSPEAVKELAAKVKELLVAFLDAWFDRYGQEFIAHYPDYYMPSGITLSEDEIGAVSEEIFVELFQPELVELSEYYGCIGIHCCAAAQHQWEHLKKIPNLRLFNIVRPTEEVSECYQFFATHVAQMHYAVHQGELLDGTILVEPENYPAGAHIVLEAYAETRDQAIELSDKLRTMYQ